MSGTENQPSFFNSLVDQALELYTSKGPTYTTPEGMVEPYTVFQASADVMEQVGAVPLERLPELIRGSMITPRGTYVGVEIFDNDNWENFMRDFTRSLVVAHIEYYHPEVEEEDLRRAKNLYGTT